MQKLAGFSWRGKRWVDNFGSPADASSSLPPSPFEIIHNDNDGARGNYNKQGSPASPPLIFPSPYSSPFFPINNLDSTVRKSNRQVQLVRKAASFSVGMFLRFVQRVRLVASPPVTCTKAPPPYVPYVQTNTLSGFPTPHASSPHMYSTVKRQMIRQPNDQTKT